MSRPQILPPRYISALRPAQTYIPAKLRYLLNPKNSVVPEGFALCLVGEKETMAADLNNANYTGYPFVHLNAVTLGRGINGYSDKVKENILYINDLVSFPGNEFNETDLGLHTMGLVPLAEIADLQSKGYGLRSWNGIGVFASVAMVVPR